MFYILEDIRGSEKQAGSRKKVPFCESSGKTLCNLYALKIRPDTDLSISCLFNYVFFRVCFIGICFFLGNKVKKVKLFRSLVADK